MESLNRPPHQDQADQRGREATETYASAASARENTLGGSLPERVGRYRLKCEIARGGMGQVVRVTDELFQRPLAMKIVLGNGLNEDARQRFVREALVTGQLQHPGIPPVQEMGQLADGRPFFVMKLIQGSDLARLLRARLSFDEDRPRFVAIFGQICQTLGYVHAHGIIHRDLKPANVMVGAFGEVQVMDWGLAKLLTPAGEPTGPAREPMRPAAAPPSDASSVFTSDTLPLGTLPGTVMGTSAYMVPEQARGNESLDPRCDVFGLGAILCEMLTGKPPFTESTSKENLLLAAAGNL